MILEIIVGLAILVYALFDLKEKAVPAFMTTILILALVIINQANLIWGVACAVLGLFLYELDFTGGQYFGGLADIKVLTIIGLMLQNLTQFATMAIILGGSGVIVAVVRHFYYGKKKAELFPFIPVLLFVYIATMIVGVWI